MCDQTEISYLDEEVVWVKLGNCWWPGEVVAPEKLSPDVLRSYRKPPIAIVKFFQEDAYEFVKNINSIYKYQCSRKHEFINKGLSLYRTKHGHMEKFPEDVIRAETKVGGDIEILTRDEFQETKKESYAGLFGTPAKKTPGSLKKGRGRPPSESPNISTPVRRMKEKTDYKVHILLQGSKPTAPVDSPATSAEASTPSTSTAVCPNIEASTSTEPKLDDVPDIVDKPISTVHTPTTLSTPSAGAGIYACHACSFTTTRLNVLILHNKSHSVSFMPYTPTPVKKKTVIKSPAKSTPKTSKQRKPRKEKTDKPAKSANKKRSLEDKSSDVESKKLKTDEEIKSSLLADWDDDVDDESNDESATAAAQSPEVPLGAESPAVPTAAELPAAQVPAERSPDKKPNSSYPEKPEASSDSNKYEFCEDEDWPVEADAGRKIPRVKNPVRTEEMKSISIDEDDMAREVADLLNKTAVPQLPSVPEPLKVEENFPEPSVVKSPDKKLESTSSALDESVSKAPPTKAIFKTKTFFRSRHSRSQDAIGKYVAEQLNNVEKMDIADCDLNGSDNVSSPEARDSPPIEHIKVARLAPKIQLKKMKAEAQLREKERNRFEPSADPYSLSDIMLHDEKPESPLEEVQDKENADTMSFSMTTQNALHSTSEIIPVSEIDPPLKDTNKMPSNYEASIESEDTCETIIEEDHHVPEDDHHFPEDDHHVPEDDHHVPEDDHHFPEDVHHIPEDDHHVTEEDHHVTKEDDLVTEVDHHVSVLDDHVTEMDHQMTEMDHHVTKSGDLVAEVDHHVTEEDHQVTKESESKETFGIEIDYEENANTVNQEIVKEVVQDSETLYQGNIDKTIEAPGIKVPDQMLCDTPEPLEPELIEEDAEQPVEPYMNESTASAVDALLSVSREADRVTRTISDDPPEDLFEDDNKDGSISSNINDDINNSIENEERSEQTLFPENIQDVVITEDIEKEPDQSGFSSSVEHPVINKKSLEIASSLKKENVTPNLLEHEEIRKYVLAENEEEIIPEKPTTNKESNESVFSPYLEEVCVSHKGSNKNVEVKNPVIHEKKDKSVFPENEKISTFHEESNTNAFLTNEDISAVQEESENNGFLNNELHIPETHEESEHIMIHSGFSEIEEEIITTQESEVVSEESVYLQSEEEIPVVQDETEIPIDNNPDEYITSSEIYQNEEVITTPHNIESSHGGSKEEEIVESIVEKVPSESDLQIAEALINLPATTLQNKTPTEQIENHNIMTNSFDLDNVQEEIIQASVEETGCLEKATEITNKTEAQSFIPDDDSVNIRFETEQEKCENLNAAQSLLHMSASIEHTISIPEPMDTNDVSDSVKLNVKQNNGIDDTIKQNVAQKPTEVIKEPEKVKKPFLTSSSKLLQILEEPSKPRLAATKITSTKQIIMRGKEKILNFDVAKSSFKSKPHSPNQKIIIRRTTPSKTVLNNLNELPSQDKIILSRSSPSQEGSSVQRFTIQTTPDAPSDANTIIIQQKIRKLAKPATKIQKIKQHSLVSTVSEANPVVETSSIDNAIFDINSMPIVLSEDLITAESIEKMPVVMSDANINPVISQPQQPPKPIKPKINVTENEKITVTSMPKKQEVKTTLLMNSVGEVQNKSATPNILSKSAKLRGAKPMLVIDKVTGKQKIIMTKAEPIIKEVRQIQKTPTIVHKTPTVVQKTLAQKTPTLVQKSLTLSQKTPTLIQKQTTLIQKTQTLIQKAPTLIQTTPTLIQTTQTLIQTTPTLLQTAPTLMQAAPQTAKQSSQAEKFIILPTQNAVRPGRTQKIVIDPQTGKAHMILSRGKDASTTAAENKPVSAKLVPSKSETNAPGNTVMIITNAQGAQSRIVLTPEHEKILFPNKQQQKGSQLKTIAHRITTTSAVPQLKAVLNPPPVRQIVASAKTPTRIVPKQKNAIITSKGQLIVGGRVTSTSPNIAPMPEIRHVSKRLSQTEPRKLVQAIQKTNSEPIIYLQQKSGAVMQLTASQFEQLQRTGQIVQKSPAQPTQERVIIQKSRTIVEAGSSQKSRARKTATHSPTPAKRSKHQHEVAIAPAPMPPARLSPLLPALTPISNHAAPAHAPTPSAPAPAVTFAPAHAISTVAAPSSDFSDFENFEEMLPSTAIARQPAPESAPPAPIAPPPPTPAAAPAPAQEPAGAALADGQLLAVPGEHFGGPVGSFYLCVEEQGTYTPIDNRPLVLENNQLVPMTEVLLQPAPAPQPERRDILSAALANSDVFHADAADAPDFRDLNANVSVHCRVSETSTTLHQPIMTPQEVPSSGATEPAPAPASLEDGLAVIGVTPHCVPTSLELPITVTDPRIAAHPASLGTTLMPSPRADLCYMSAEEAVGPISMPLLTEEEDAGSGEGGGGMSMPILTDDVGGSTVSSVESALGSPASLGAEVDDGAGVTWTRRLLTPGSDASDLSVEIPLQPSIQISVGDLSDHT